MQGETEITHDELIDWVKADPEKVRRIILAEGLVGKYGSIEIMYHDGKVGTILARQSRQCLSIEENLSRSVVF